MARLRIAFMFFGLSLILVACNFGAAGPSAPCSVTVSKQAADRLIQKIRAEFGPPGKSITVKATDEEVSSLFT
ncbi:MAG: hypothetical protein HY259_00265, partial [Chloroflexi bacterium]|nr:hypothetical protein [Chloroflexota bacterium]